MAKTRIKILEHINNNAGFRLGNVNRGIGSMVDKALLGEALGFRSLCLYSCLDDKTLKYLWDNSNLKFML